MKAGKKKVVDMFGERAKYEELYIEAAQGMELPWVLIRSSAIILYKVDFGERLIPYAVFDHLRSWHQIDVLSPSVSLTGDGDIYRACVLLTGTDRGL